MDKQISLSAGVKDDRAQIVGRIRAVTHAEEKRLGYRRLALASKRVGVSAGGTSAVELSVRTKVFT